MNHILLIKYSIYVYMNWQNAQLSHFVWLIPGKGSEESELACLLEGKPLIGHVEVLLSVSIAKHEQQIVPVS